MRALVSVLACLACVVGCAGHAISPPASAPGRAPSFAAEAVDIAVDWQGSPPPSTIGVKPAAISLTSSDGTGLRLATLETRAVLYGPLAFTELHLSFENTEDRQREGTFSITLPPSAAVSRFAMRLAQGWQEGEVVEKKAAREAYERFLHRNVDPALLEKDTGNVFRGRVFPILARTRKDIVIAWTEELPSAGTPYRFALRGLPAVDELDVQLLVPSRKKAFILHRQQWAADRDFVYMPPKGSPEAVRGGNFAVARRAPPAGAADAAAPIDSLAVLVDSSASRAGSYARDVGRLGEVVAALGAKTVHVACFDQEVEPVPSVADAAKRAPAGASDLRAALRWLKTTGAKRALLVTDGIASVGPIETSELAAEIAQLESSGVERVDAIAAGAQRNEPLLRALTTAGLANPGVVLDGDSLTPEAMASRLRHEARPEAGLVYLDLAFDKPLRIATGGGGPRDVLAEEAPARLVERAVAKSRIEAMTIARNSPTASEAERERLREAIVVLSRRNRVVSDFTSMLVLESEYDYARFGIQRTALDDILVVGPSGVQLVPRGGGLVLLPKASGVSPLLDFRARDEAKLPLDSDGDGIPDSMDKCPMDPETFNGREDDDGCPETARVILQSNEIRILQAIHFADGGARILPESFSLLDELATVLLSNPQIDLVELQGHTDASGSAAANQALSQARAQAVLDALVKRGVPATRLRAKGYGSTRPIDRNDTAEARARNRRVEFLILTFNGQPTESAQRRFTPAKPQPSPPPPDRRARSGKAAPHGPPLDGAMHEIDMLLAQHQNDEALARAQAWRARAPADLLATIAEGRALEAKARYRDAARAYGSMLDLATKPEHRRAAAGFLESLGAHHPPALELAIDAYRRAAAERPEVPSSHRLLAYSLARAGRVAEAFEIVLAALVRAHDDSRYPGAFELLEDDAGWLAAALARGRTQPERGALEDRVKAAGGKVPTKPSTRVFLSWETDESDLDLRLVEPKGSVVFSSRDARRGYGPEMVELDPTTSVPPTVEVHQVTRGPSGFSLGKVAIVRQDGHGRMTFEDRPFVVMIDGAAVVLGAVK